MTIKEKPPLAYLSLELLRFIRDERPSEMTLLHWLGAADAGLYYVLRDARLVELSQGRVRLSPACARAGGAKFHYQNVMYLLDEDRVMVF
jgi:hypothetical protein